MPAAASRLPAAGYFVERISLPAGAR